MALAIRDSWWKDLRFQSGIWPEGREEGGARIVAVTELRALVARFAENVMAQKEALRRKNPRAGNRYARIYIAAWNALKTHGDQGRDALCELLSHSCDDVRGMAAACLLKYRTDDAKRVLTEVGRGQGLAAFGASEALQRWAEGDWHLDE